MRPSRARARPSSDIVSNYVPSRVRARAASPLAAPSDIVSNHVPSRARARAASPAANPNASRARARADSPLSNPVPSRTRAASPVAVHLPSPPAAADIFNIVFTQLQQRFIIIISHLLAGKRSRHVCMFDQNRKFIHL